MGGGPCPVDDRIVEAIRTRVEGWWSEPPQLAPGDRVRVTAGTFADLEGIFCESLSGDQRVAILLDMMRREIRVELSMDDVERVKRGAAA